MNMSDSQEPYSEKKTSENSSLFRHQKSAKKESNVNGWDKSDVKHSKKESNVIGWDKRDVKHSKKESNVNGWGKSDVKHFLSRFSSNEINLIEASVIMVSVVVGGFVITLPYTVVQVGLISWILLFILIALLIGHSGHLMTESCVRMLDEYKHEKIILAPLMKVSNLAGGKVLSSIVTATFYLNLTASAISTILLTSTTLSEIVTMPGIPKNNRVRIWTVVSVVCISPLVHIGFYKDLKQSAFISLVSSLLALFASLGVSIYILLNWNLPEIEQKEIIQPSIDNYFRAAGTIFFSISGITIITPEIMVFVNKPRKMFYYTISVYCLLGLIFSAYCILMYLTYGMYLQPTTTATLSNALALNGDSTGAKVCVIIMQLCLCMHFLLATVLLANPIFTNVEASLNIPPEYNWKMFVVRTIGLLLLTTGCVLLPHLLPVISLYGGTLIALSAVIYPIIIYVLLHELTLLKKGLYLVMILVTTVIIVGSFVTSVRDFYLIFKNE